ncbi:hypothetical protein HPNQ4216_0424 [Helicobacter pylori NQ4216]|nr:hypothetical protein HPNQ4216_0424 [Helicobacter pylori NQ4216]
MIIFKKSFFNDYKNRVLITLILKMPSSVFSKPPFLKRV